MLTGDSGVTWAVRGQDEASAQRDFSAAHDLHEHARHWIAFSHTQATGSFKRNFREVKLVIWVNSAFLQGLWGLHPKCQGLGPNFERWG